MAHRHKYLLNVYADMHLAHDAAGENALEARRGFPRQDFLALWFRRSTLMRRKKEESGRREVLL